MTARWLAAPAAAAVFALGVWVTGGLITDQFKLAMALTAAWFVVAGLGAWRAGRPALTGFVVAAVAVGGFLAWSTLRDTTVHERLPAGPALASGRFQSLEHTTTGEARIVGRQVVIENLRTSPGPDLRVRLDGRDLGALKGNIGDQHYEIPSDVDPARAQVVEIWCRAFSAGFGRARLTTQ